MSIIIIGPGLDSRARTALEHMLESVVSARGKVLRTNFSATSRVNASNQADSGCPSCPKMRTEPRARILEAFLRFAETSQRGTGSAIGAPEQTSPPDHPFRPAGAPELLCGGAVVITEQTAQSLTTPHLPVRTADAFFRFEQRVPKPLMAALSVIMMDELSDGHDAAIAH